MSYISEREYASRMKALQEANKSKERELNLKKEKNKYGFKLKLPSTSKIVLFVVFALCLQIIFFCEKAMVESGDYSALYVLIGAPVTLVPVCLGYYWKSKNENTAGGIIYEQAMQQNTEPYVDTTLEGSQC